jgi:hypothetical protein
MPITKQDTGSRNINVAFLKERDGQYEDQVVKVENKVPNRSENDIKKVHYYFESGAVFIGNPDNQSLIWEHCDRLGIEDLEVLADREAFISFDLHKVGNPNGKGKVDGVHVANIWIDDENEPEPEETKPARKAASTTKTSRGKNTKSKVEEQGIEPDEQASLDEINANRKVPLNDLAHDVDDEDEDEADPVGPDDDDDDDAGVDIAELEAKLAALKAGKGKGRRA